MGTAGCANAVADWQLDIMRQNENSRIWEQMHGAPDHTKVISKLCEAVNSIHTAESRLGSAAELVYGTPMDDKIMSHMFPLEEVCEGIRALISQLEKEMGR